jgi:hypothetical protein
MYHHAANDGTQPMIIASDHDSDATEVLFTLEALTQAGIIFIMGVAIILTNVLIVATFLNYRGKYRCIRGNSSRHTMPMTLSCEFNVSKT